jgi:hypothetical protein
MIELSRDGVIISTYLGFYLLVETPKAKITQRTS